MANTGGRRVVQSFKVELEMSDEGVKARIDKKVVYVRARTPVHQVDAFLRDAEDAISEHIHHAMVSQLRFLEAVDTSAEKAPPLVDREPE